MAASASNSGPILRACPPVLERVAQRPFDGIIVVDDGASDIVGGLSLLERIVWTFARAGAQRLLLLGKPSALRLPVLPVEWGDSIGRWIRGTTGPIVVAYATTITVPETVAAFAHAEPRGPLRTPGTHLWRLDPADTLPDEARGSPLPTPNARVWSAPADALVTRATDAPSRAAAERALYARLGRNGDGWFTRLVDRRLSRALTRLLLPTGIAPNTVTIASIAIGVIGGLCFALGGPTTSIVGALLFLASTIVDGCDGEIARLTFRETPFGAKLDILGDNLVHLFLFGGIAIGLYRRSGDPIVAILGPTLLGGVLLAMATVYVTIVRHQPNDRQRKLFEAFASREFAYLLVLLTVVGRLDWFLWLSAVGTYAFSFGLLGLASRRSRPH